MAAMTHVKQGGLIVVRPGEGKSVNFGGLGAQFKVWGYQTSGRLAIVENPIAPYRLVPPHVHTMEDELSYVLEGKIGVRIGDEIVEAKRGTYVYKPFNVRHTVWNPGPRPAGVHRSSSGQASRITLQRSQSFSKEAESRVALNMRSSLAATTNRFSSTGCRS